VTASFIISLTFLTNALTNDVTFWHSREGIEGFGWGVCVLKAALDKKLEIGTHGTGVELFKGEALL
jgi:hypothetical protein